MKLNVKGGKFDTINVIGGKLTLVQLVDTVVNVNHEVIIAVILIYDSNYEKSLPLEKELFKLICSSSYNYDIYAKFEKLYYEVICYFPIALSVSTVTTYE